MDLIVRQILQVLIGELLLNAGSSAIHKEKKRQLEQMNHEESYTPDALRSILPKFHPAEESGRDPDEQI